MNYSYRLTLLSICVLLTAVLTAGVAMADIITYKANLTGVNAIPPNASAATGIAILTDCPALRLLPMFIMVTRSSIRFPWVAH